MDNIKISAIIPTYINSPEIVDLLSDCVASLVGYDELILQFDKTGEGFSKTVNKGVARSSGNYIAIINNDTRMLEGSLRDYCKPNFICRPTLEGAPGKFAFVVMPRSVWDLVGGLDEDFKIGFYEDKLFLVRARDEFGIPSVILPLRVWHKGSATISKMNPEELKRINRKIYLAKGYPLSKNRKKK